MTRAWTGRDILIALIATFGVIFGVNGYFILEAERTWPGEDVANPYLQGLDYNQTLDARARQRALGWSATIGGVLSGGNATITVTLRDRNGKPVTGEAMTGLLRHPMDEQRDRKIVLRETGNGIYAGSAANVPPGSWDVVITRKSNKEAPFEAERRLWLR
jgi:nitrogen fixation protein FixH